MPDTSSIHDLIQSLLDVSNPFPPALLHQFSDLDHEEAQILLAAWPAIPVERRRNFLQDLVELSEHDDLMMFDLVGMIGLDDADDDVVVRAIDLLFVCEQKSLVPKYLALLTDENRSELVRAAAANVLGPYVYLGELEKLKAELLKNIEDSLLDATKFDPSDLVRRRALESLGFSSREEVPPLIRLAYAQHNPDWVESAMFAMGRSADEQWEEDILENLDHTHLGVQLQAIHAAGELELSSARRFLLKLAVRESIPEELRREVVWALAHIGGKDVLEVFERLIARSDDDDEIDFLEEAIDTLNFTNDPSLFDLMDLDPNKGRASHDHEHDEDDEFSFDDEENGFEEDDLDDEFLIEEDEWSRYVSEDDLGEEEDSYDFEDDVEDDLR